MSRTTKYVEMSVLLALSMIFSYVESQIPFHFSVPGVKLGVANLVAVTGLYFLGITDVLVISVARVLLGGFLFGNGMTILYSLAGALVSVSAMAIAKKTGRFSVIGISIMGGVSHNLGQICMAVVVLGNVHLLYYCPVLLIAGAVTGCMIGIVSARVLSIVKKEASQLGDTHI